MTTTGIRPTEEAAAPPTSPPTGEPAPGTGESRLAASDGPVTRLPVSTRHLPLQQREDGCPVVGIGVEFPSVREADLLVVRMVTDHGRGVLLQFGSVGFTSAESIAPLKGGLASTTS